MPGKSTWVMLWMMMETCFHGSTVFVLTGTDPACGNLGPGSCQFRAAKCGVVKELAQGNSGPVKDVFDCATTLGIPKTQIVPVIGPAFASGHPETIVDRITSDPANALKLRRCVLTAGGLVTMNGMLDRAAMVTRLQQETFSTHPLVIDTIAAAVTQCPEPENLQIASFLTCVRSACIQQMPPDVANLPVFSYSDDDDDDDHKKKCKKGKKCKKH